MNKAVIIYGRQGCGKTLRADDMKAHFGKARVVDHAEFLYHRFPADAVVLAQGDGWAGNTQRYGEPVTAISFEQFLRDAGLVEKHAEEMRKLRAG
jgi:hypothetical protein